MVSRRDFIEKASVGAATIAAAPILMGGAQKAQAQASAPVFEQSNRTKGGKWRSRFRLGQGGAPIGGSSGIGLSDEQALATLASSWDSGMRFYDTSPWYGLGLSERRFGMSLHRKVKSDYELSTKIGRLLTAAPTPPETAWAEADSFDYTYDYSAEATRRSVEDSLQRLGISAIDVIFIHDLSPDNGDFTGSDYEDYMQQAIQGAMPELTKMREEGLIKGWGMGVNTLDPILRCNEAADPDLHLAACQYTLMDHAESLEKLFPSCDHRGISIVVGSPLNNGFLAGENRYNYSGEIPEGFKAKRARMAAIAKSHGTDLRTAALHFCSAPETVSTIIPGANKPIQPRENVKSMQTDIPADLWAELKSEKLISENAPV